MSPTSPPVANEPTRSGAKAGGLRRGLTLAERQAERRDALLDAALELFGTQGYARTPVKHICELAQVSSRDFYDLYDNRAAVLVALGARIEAGVFEAFVDAWETTPDPPFDRIVAAIGAVTRHLASDPRIVRIAYIETLGVSPEQDKMRRQGTRRFAGLYADALEADFERAGLDRQHAIAASMALVGGASELVADWAFAESRSPVDELVQLVEDTFRALFPRPADPTS